MNKYNGNSLNRFNTERITKDVNDALQDQDDDADFQKSIKETLAVCYQKDKEGCSGLRKDTNIPTPARRKVKIQKIVWDLEEKDSKNRKRRENKRKKISMDNDADAGLALRRTILNTSASSLRDLDHSSNPFTSNQYPFILSSKSQDEKSKPFRYI